MQFKEGCFYPGLMSDEDKNIVQTCELNPVVLLMQMEYRLYVCLVGKRGDDGGLTIGLCDERGFTSAYLSKKAVFENPDNPNSKITFKYECYAYQNAECFDYSTSTTMDGYLVEVVSTTKIRYMMNALVKAKSDPRGPMSQLHERNNKKLSNLLQQSLIKSYEELSERQAHKTCAFELNQTQRTKLMQLFANNMASEFTTLNSDTKAPSFSEAEKRQLVTICELIHERNQANASLREQFRQYFVGDRFVLIYHPSSTHVVFGQIQWTNVEEVMEHTYTGKYSFYDGPSVTTSLCDFRRYKSVETLPEDVRDVVLSTLHLDKMNRTSKSPVSNSQALLPHPQRSTAAVFTNSSSTCYKGNSDNAVTIYNLPDKRRLLA